MPKLWNKAVIEEIRRKKEEWQKTVNHAEKGEQKVFKTLSGLPVKPL
jgi:hypothetical protein